MRSMQEDRWASSRIASLAQQSHAEAGASRPGEPAAYSGRERNVHRKLDAPPDAPYLFSLRRLNAHAPPCHGVSPWTR